MRGIRRIFAAVTSRKHAAFLDRQTGDPPLDFGRRGFLADGRPVGFTKTRYDGESYEFLTELWA